MCLVLLRCPTLDGQSWDLCRETKLTARRALYANTLFDCTSIDWKSIATFVTIENYICKYLYIYFVELIWTNIIWKAESCKWTRHQHAGTNKCMVFHEVQDIWHRALYDPHKEHGFTCIPKQTTNEHHSRTMWTKREIRRPDRSNTHLYYYWIHHRRARSNNHLWCGIYHRWIVTIYHRCVRELFES